MSSQVTIENLEHQLISNKERVALRDVVIRLTNNRDFKKVIQDGFMEEHAARNIRLSVDPQTHKDEVQHCIASAQAAGYLKQYLSALIQMGNVAANQIPEIEAEMDEMRAEGADEAEVLN